MLPSADDPQQADSQQSWPGLFWLPPAGAGPNERDMLRLDDELAGLIEAADMPADQHGTHTTRPEAASSMPGESSLVCSKMGALLALCCVMLCCVMLCCAVRRLEPVLQRHVVRSALLCCDLPPDVMPLQCCCLLTLHKPC